MSEHDPPHGRRETPKTELHSATTTPNVSPRNVRHDNVDESQMLATLLECIPISLFVCDASMAVTHLNRRARAIARRDDRLNLTRGRLEIADPKAKRALEQASRSGTQPSALSLPPTAPPQRTLGVLIVPIQGASPVPGDRPRVIVFISDPRETEPLPEGLLANALALRPAESRVVSNLATGATLSEIARTLDLKIATVRWQLAQVTTSSGARRQPEIVRLALTSAAVFAPMALPDLD